MNQAFVFLDTMIFLHFQEITSIDLLSILKCDSAVIVIPRITIRELDEQKVRGTSPRIRDRARRSLNLIEEFSTTANRVREGITLEFYAEAPDVNFSALGLERSWGDDYLIASVLSFRALKPEAEVYLVSDDTGVRMKCKTLEIKTLTLPDNYKSKEEIDPREEENRKLKQRVQQLENAMPKLQIVFSDSESNHHEFLVYPPLQISQLLIDEKVRNAREQIKNHIQAKDAERKTDSIIHQMTRIPISECERFERECEEFPDRVREFETGLLEFQNLKRRSFKFKLALINEGTCAAEDIDIHLHFPDGFQMKEGWKLPFGLHKPQLPAFPRSEIQLKFQEMQAGIDFDALRPRLPKLTDSTFEIRRSNSYDVTWFLPKLKHGMIQEFPTMLVWFEEWADACPFKCEYTLKVENLPRPINGSIDFVVKRVKVE